MSGDVAAPYRQTVIRCIFQVVAQLKVIRRAFGVIQCEVHHHGVDVAQCPAVFGRTKLVKLVQLNMMAVKVM